MKVLFLDFDGVLNDSRFLLSSTDKRDPAIVVTYDPKVMLDPERARRVQSVCDRTGAKVVLSTSWRCLYGIDEIRAWLPMIGLTAEVYCSTPRIYDAERHVEIRAWLEGRDVDAFAIVDDDQDAGVGFEDEFVGTVDGIEDEHVEKLVRILGEVRA